MPYQQPSRICLIKSHTNFQPTRNRTSLSSQQQDIPPRTCLLGNHFFFIFFNGSFCPTSVTSNLHSLQNLWKISNLFWSSYHQFAEVLLCIPLTKQTQPHWTASVFIFVDKKITAFHLPYAITITAIPPGTLRTTTDHDDHLSTSTEANSN